MKKTATPDKRLPRVFGAIGISPLRPGTGALLCPADALGEMEGSDPIVPIRLIRAGKKKEIRK